MILINFAPCPLRTARNQIKERFHVKRIGLFGSFARGDEKETSDVDIMVEFEEPTFDNFMKLAFFLEDLFGKKVELVTPDSLSPYIASYVTREVVWADQR
jgi:predicted nucleotidyltransferase